MKFSKANPRDFSFDSGNFFSSRDIVRFTKFFRANLRNFSFDSDNFIAFSSSKDIRFTKFSRDFSFTSGNFFFSSRDIVLRNFLERILRIFRSTRVTSFRPEI